MVRQQPTILVVSHVVPCPPSAGNEIRILKMLHWFRGQGYRVVLLLNHEPLAPEQQRDLDGLVDAVHFIGDEYGATFPPLRNPALYSTLMDKLRVAMPDSA